MNRINHAKVEVYLLPKKVRGIYFYVAAKTTETNHLSSCDTVCLPLYQYPFCKVTKHVILFQSNFSY